MNKSLYYIECICVHDCKFPNAEYHIGDILYVNPKAASNETYIYNYRSNSKETIELCEYIKNKYNVLISQGHLPFVRQKKNAKKWQIKRYAESLAYDIEKRGDFKCNVKEIKMIYEEEEV